VAVLAVNIRRSSPTDRTAVEIVDQDEVHRRVVDLDHR
jgi:hypothetical protein